MEELRHAGIWKDWVVIWIKFPLPLKGFFEESLFDYLVDSLVFVCLCISSLPNEPIAGGGTFQGTVSQVIELPYIKKSTEEELSSDEEQLVYV